MSRSNHNHFFSPRKSIEQIEESKNLCPKFDEQNLVPVVTTDYDSGEVLMHGYMNEEALRQTILNREAYYYSRSRGVLWHKGATSGLVQKLIEMRVDDDQDCIWLRVRVEGGASCHVGYRSCFYRQVDLNYENPDQALEFMEHRKVFDPQKIYPDSSNPTRI